MRTPFFSRHRGFSLAELLVGMAMGVIVLLIVMQTLSTAEQFKRTATNGSDAQINGLMALRTLESEVRMAGAGLNNGAALCPSISKYYDGGGGSGAAAVTSTIPMPVRINDGATAALNYSDSIDIVYSSSLTGGLPTHITDSMPIASNVTRVSNVSGMNTCDFVLFASKDGTKACSLMQITSVGNNGVQFLTSSGQSNYNPPGGFNDELFPPGGYTTDDTIINMGKSIERRYAVVKDGTNDQYYFQLDNLAAAQPSGCGAADPNPQLKLISNVVNIQAQYGVANAGSQEVSCWTGAATTDTGCSISAGNWSAPAAVDVRRVKAVRVAVVVRSAIAEKPSSGGTCDTTTTAPTAWANGPTINLGHVSNWQCYRYKVFQTVIPVINVIWANI